MSIASRIEAIEGHITNDYQALSDIGADLTGVDKNIENIANVLADIYDEMPKVSDTGTDLTLENTRKGAMAIKYKGHTQQDSTTGKNLAKVDYSFNTSSNSVSCKVNADGSITLNGTASANTTFVLSTGLGYASGQYTLSCEGLSTDSDRIRIRCRNSNGQYSDSGSNIAEVQYNINSRTFTRDVNNVEILVLSGKTTNCTLKIQLETGNTKTSWQKYSGGTPAPNPDYPQEIHNVSGDNTIEICGKNLFDKDTCLFVSDKRYNDSGQIVNDSNSSYSSLIRVQPNTTYTISNLNGEQHKGVRTALFDINKTFIQRTESIQENTITITTTSTTYYLSIQGRETSAMNIDTIQMEKGDQSTTYEAYTEQSQLISLGTIELCKIGTYQDYIYKEDDKWYLHKEIGKFILKTGYGTQQYENNTYIKMNRPNNAETGYTGDKVINGYCNVGQWKTGGHTWNSAITGLFIGASSTQWWIGMGSAKTSGEIDDFVANNNITVYYVLATPTDTEITDTTLLEQLETIKKSYDGITNISQENNDLPFILDVSALKEWSNE